LRLPTENKPEEFDGLVMNPKPLSINGRHVTAESSHAVTNPWDGSHLGDVCLAGAAQVEDAVASAHSAFQGTRKMTADARAVILENIAALIAERRSDFVSTIIAEAGKPVTFAEAETDRARLTFRFAAALALADEGHGIAMDASAPGAGHFGFVKRFPMGVILGITPFNFPLNLAAHKVAPCLATGNTMVLKPSPRTPLSSLLLAEVLDAAGVPPGQINVVPFDHDLVPPLLMDPRIKMISFTGSAPVGWRLKSLAARKKVALELGGNAAVVVEPDCDWQSAIPKIAAAAYGYAGQSCISVQRILVHKDIHAAFREALVACINEKIPAGDPSEKSTIVGPMIHASAREKILYWRYVRTRFEDISQRFEDIESFSASCSGCADALKLVPGASTRRNGHGEAAIWYVALEVRSGLVVGGCVWDHAKSALCPAPPI